MRGELRMMRRRREAFTLIELLVAIAAMSLLAGFLLPVFAQAREKSRQARCLSNLRQLATGMLIYAEDHDGLLPPAVSREQEEPLALPQTWLGHLRPYLKSATVLIDPSSGRRNADWRASNDLLMNYGYPPSRRVAGMVGQTTTAPSFGTALWEGLGGFYGPPTGDYRQQAPSCSQAQVARPAETILLCDHQVFDWGVSQKKLYFPALRHLREPDLRLPDGSMVPQGILNVVFVDGHARALTHAQFWDIRPDHARLTAGRFDVFTHFWPYA
jgi:prepilin-type N-terminal cleavage/methylation domain-containing protein/prepilin-type processing-associated H-X9-DG protein